MKRLICSVLVLVFVLFNVFVDVLFILLMLDNGEYEIFVIMILLEGIVVVLGVILLYGSVLYKNEVGDLYLCFVEQLVNNGIVFIRIDFVGIGDSLVDYMYYMLKIVVCDVEVVLVFLCLQLQVDDY